MKQKGGFAADRSPLFSTAKHLKNKRSAGCDPSDYANSQSCVATRTVAIP